MVNSNNVQPTHWSECLTEAYLVQDRGLWWLVHGCLVVITATDGSSQESWVWFPLAAGFSLLVFLTDTWSRRVGRTWRNFYSQSNSDCGWHGNCGCLTFYCGAYERRQVGCSCGTEGRCYSRPGLLTSEPMYYRNMFCNLTGKQQYVYCSLPALEK